MGEVDQATEETLEETLEVLREAIREERISYYQLYVLQSLGDEGLIPDDDLELLQWAGVEEEDYVSGEYAKRAKRAKEGSRE